MPIKHVSNKATNVAVIMWTVTDRLLCYVKNIAPTI